MVLSCMEYFREIPISYQMLCIAIALKSIFCILFFILIFYTVLFPVLHFDTASYFETSSQNSVRILKITLIGSAVFRELVFSTFLSSAVKFTVCFTAAF